MNETRQCSSVFSVAMLVLVAVAPVQGQKTALDIGYGVWLGDSLANIFSVSLQRSLLGPFDWGLGVTHLRGERGDGRDRISGAEVSLGLFRNGSGPYAVAAGGIGMRHDGGNFDAQWSAGAGYASRLTSFLSAALEARYRVEDRASRGFWRLDPEDARGVLLQARLTFGRGSGRSRSSTTNRPSLGPETITSAPPRPIVAGRDPSVDRDVVALRNAVVSTAREVMGTPYRWGGEGEGGFDCSGLIKYAYAQHGLLLPRNSRDQARMGMAVELSVTQLQPGDILGFSEGGGGVTHVGLYVGDGMFIHSASDGVKLSSLVSPEGDGRWWQRRWVSARRLLN